MRFFWRRGFVDLEGLGAYNFLFWVLLLPLVLESAVLRRFVVNAVIRTLQLK
jgi:hypothetical protein